MRSLVFFLTVFILFPIVAEKNSEHLKSRVFFYKNVSEDNLSGWEKDFFKDFFKEQPVSFPDMDISDDEISDTDIISKKKKLVRPKPNKKLYKTLEVIKKRVEEPETVPDDIPEIPDVEKKQKRPEPDIDLFPETVDEDKVEVPDNEVDRSDRIRKMKELLKKRKGKRRIDKRRIH